MNSNLVLHSVQRGVSKADMAMANPADDDASMRRVTTGTAKGYLVPRAADERANFIHAVTVGLNDLETGRDVSFDDAAIRLGVD